MTALPTWLLLYLTIGLLLLLMVVWRTPQVIRAPAGGRALQAMFLFGFIPTSILCWPFPAAIAVRECCQILRAARYARRSSS